MTPAKGKSAYIEAPVTIPRRRTPFKRALALSLVVHIILLLAAGVFLSVHFGEREELLRPVELVSAMDPRLRPFREVEPRTAARRMEIAKVSPRPAPTAETMLIRRPPPPARTPQALPPSLPPSPARTPLTVPGQTKTATAPIMSPGTPTTTESSPSPASSPVEEKDLSLIINYRNDERLTRDEKGNIILDQSVLEEIDNLKPILIAVPDLIIVPERARDLGIERRERIRASVAVTIVLPRGAYGAPAIVGPSNIQVTEIHKEPPPEPTADQHKAIEAFIIEKIAQTRWFPALDQGVPKEQSSETFDVEIGIAPESTPAPETPKATSLPETPEPGQSPQAPGTSPSPTPPKAAPSPQAPKTTPSPAPTKAIPSPQTPQTPPSPAATETTPRSPAPLPSP